MRARLVHSGSSRGCLACNAVTLGLNSLPEHPGSSRVSAVRLVIAKRTAKTLSVCLVLDHACKVRLGASAA